MRETDELHRVCRPTSAGVIQAKPEDTDIDMRSLHEDGETVENTVRSSEGAEGELIPFSTSPCLTSRNLSPGLQ